MPGFAITPTWKQGFCLITVVVNIRFRRASILPGPRQFSLNALELIGCRDLLTIDKDP